jgi:hypothetical protein
MKRTNRLKDPLKNQVRPMILEKFLRRKQRYLLAAFFDQVADPMEHACLGLSLAGHHGGIRLVVKGIVSRRGGYFKG